MSRIILVVMLAAVLLSAGAEFTGRDCVALSGAPLVFSPVCATAPAAWRCSPRSAAPRALAHRSKSLSQNRIVSTTGLGLG